MGADERSLIELSKALGHPFRQPAFLAEALTHPSVAGRAAHGYQRLEFLGDRVLGLVVADLLFRRYPDDDEGALSRRHAALVRADTLADVAEAIDLGAYLALSAGEASAGARGNRALLADACEAVIGALYVDGGLAAAAAFIERHWSARLAADEPARDAKTALQEWAQGRGLPLPDYRTLSRTGPDHAPLFTVEARVEGLTPATAEGPSKRAAEQAAAALLLAAARAHAEAHDA